MLTRRGLSVILMGVFFLTSGFSLISYLLSILGIFLLSSVVVSFPLFKSSATLGKITVTRKINKKKVFAYDYVYVKVTLINKGYQTIDYLEIYDAYPETFDLVLGTNHLITRLDPGKKFVFSYVLLPKLRGEYKLGPCKLIVQDKLKFFSMVRTVTTVTNIVVYPPYEDIKRMEIMAKKRILGKLFGVHRTRERGIGTEFASIRQYNVGDEYRRIDWKASARMGKLMIREFETERNMKIIILLDASYSMAAGPIETSKLEFAIRAVSILAKFALERKDEVGLCVFSSDVHEFVEPKSSERHFYRILDALARVKAKGGTNLLKAIDLIAKKFRKKAYLVVISDLEEAGSRVLDAIKFAKARGYEILVISPFGPWFEIGERALSPVDKALAEAISIELWEERREVIRNIKRLDVDVLTVGPDDIIPTLISEYIKAKKRGIGQF